MIQKEMTVGDLAAQMPWVTGVFQTMGIDFCCGGKTPLADALAEKGLSIDVFQAQAEAARTARAASADADFTQMDAPGLSAHIEDVHHSYLRRALPEIERAMLSTLAAHGERHTELFQIHTAFSQLKGELERHLIKEEVLLFPALSRGEAVQALSSEIVHEHEAAGALLAQMRNLTLDYAAPDDACATFRNLYKMLVELEGDLFQHIHLENNILLKGRYA
ncbi:MAG: iron-sulfur cluster repair di-iron protein [Christensenellales bacterium]